MAARDVLFAIYQTSYRDTYPLFTTANARASHAAAAAMDAACPASGTSEASPAGRCN